MVLSEPEQDEYGPAPGDLELVRQFVNTMDAEAGTERLETPEGLARWLEEYGFPVDPAPDTEALARAFEFREQLRALLLANNGHPLEERTKAALAATAAEARASFGVDATGGVAVRPAAGGVDGLIAGLLAIASRAQSEGTWARLKACPDETCAWAFYDESRNSSRTWCSMGVCGNRAKTRRYRERRKTAHSDG